MVKYCRKCEKETERKSRGDCKPCANRSTAVYAKANTEKVKTRRAAYYKANLEKMRARNAIWRKANPEKRKAAWAAWYGANLEKVKAKNAAWRKANPEKMKALNDATTARNRAKNKDRDPHDGTDKRCPGCREIFPRTKKMWFNSPSAFDGLHHLCRDCMAISNLKTAAKRRGEILDLPDPFTGKEMRKLKKRQKNRCFVCGKKANGSALHLDHSHVAGRIRGYAHDECNVGILRGLDALYLIDPTITDNPTIKKILCDYPARYLYS